jgi:hypothetical protein
MAIVAWTAVVGLGWATLLRPRSGTAERIGLAYLLGLAIVVASMLGWQLAGQRYAPIPLLIVTAAVGAVPFAVSILISTRTDVPPAVSESLSAGQVDSPLARLAQWMLPLALGAVILANLAVATYQPTLRWDELSHHMLAGKIFFHEGGITHESGMLTQDVRTYPPFVPLSRTWLYVFTGSDNPAPNHLVSWAMFASFLAVFHARLRDFVSATTSLLFTLIASLLMFWGGTESLIDFPLIAYGGLGVLFAASALRQRTIRLALVSGLLLGAGGLVRPDGLSFGLTNLALFAFFALVTIRRWSALQLVGTAMAGFVIAFLPWVMFKSGFWNQSINAETYLGGGFGEMVFAALRRGAIDPDTLIRVVSFVFPTFNQTYGYVLLLAIVLLPLGLPDRKPNAFLSMAVLMNAAIYFTALYAFLLAGRDDLALREETAIRFGVRLLPLLVFTIGTLPLVDEAVSRTLGWRRGAAASLAGPARA